MQIQGGVRGTVAPRAQARRLIRVGLSLSFVWALVVAFPRGSLESQPAQPTGQPPDPGPLKRSATTQLGITYAGMLAVDKPARDADYDWLSVNHYGLVRVWATWSGKLGRGGCGTGSLVTSSGTLSVVDDGQVVKNFRELLLRAHQEKWVIDITFDTEEFQVIGGTSFAQYKKGIATVVNYIRSIPTPDGKGVTSDVIIDAANEVMDASKADSTSNPKFLKLYNLDGTVGTNYWTLLRSLLDTARGTNPTIRAFFSMVGVGSVGDSADDQSSVERGAERYNKVYAKYNGQDQLHAPLLAPHFARGPCFDGWASRLSARVSYMRDYNSHALAWFETYMQEENKRGGGCCTDTLATLGEVEPLVTGCTGGWPAGCYKNYDSPWTAWRTSAQKAKESDVYAWVFHTTAGMGRDNPDRQIYEHMDPVEKTIATSARTWLGV